MDSTLSQMIDEVLREKNKTNPRDGTDFQALYGKVSAIVGKTSEDLVGSVSTMPYFTSKVFPDIEGEFLDAHSLGEWDANKTGIYDLVSETITQEQGGPRMTFKLTKGAGSPAGKELKAAAKGMVCLKLTIKS